MATYTWVSGKSGTWTTGGNWTTAGFPGASDTAFLTNTGTTTFTSGVTAAVGTLDVNATGANLLLSGGTLTIQNLGSFNAGTINTASGRLSIDQSFTMTGASTTTFNNGGLVDGGTGALALGIKAGTWNNTGTLIANTITIAGGNLAGNGGTISVTGTGANVTINTSGTGKGLATGAGSVFNDTGNLTVTAGGFTDNSTASTITGLLSIAGPSSSTLAQFGGAAADVANVGTLSDTGSGGNLQFNAGIVNILQSNSVTIGGGVIATFGGGTLNASAGGMNLGAASQITGSGAINNGTISGTGTLTASAGLLDIGSAIASGPILTLTTLVNTDLKIDGVATSANAISLTNSNQTLEIGTAGRLTVSQSETISGGNIQLDGGSLTATSLLVSSGQLSGIGLVTGAVSGSGTIAAGSATTAGTLEIASAIASGPVLTIGATQASDLKLDAGDTAGTTITLNNSNQTLEIGASGALTITPAQTISAGNIQLDGGSFTDTNGLVINGGSLTGSGTVNPAITGSGGAIRARSGVLDITSSVATGQIFQVGTNAAATLKFDSIATTGTTVTLNNGNQTLEIGAAGVLTIGQSETISGGTIKLDGGTLTDSSGLVISSGTVIGSGVINPNITGTGGTITASGGVLTLNGTDTAPLAIAGSTSSILNLGNVAQSNETVNFASGGGVLELNPGTNAFTTSTVVSMQTWGGTATNEVINIQGSAVTKAQETGGNTLTITQANGTVTTISLTTPGGNGAASWRADNGTGGLGGSLGGYDVFLVCYAAGTRIDTPDGGIAVEDLREGDTVLALDSDEYAPTPVKWIGHRRLDLTAHPHPELVAPVRVRRNAFGENLPRRDLVLSPDHCVFVDDKLVPIKLLINDMTITQERDTRAVTYYHVELDRHAVLLAEGLPAESYLDTGNRAFFSNAGLALVLHPEFHVNAGLRCWETDACAPLAVSAEAVEPIWQDLVDRAEALGFARPEIITTDEADLRLRANGRDYRPISVDRGWHVFMLPPGTSDVRLASRAGAPSEVVPYLEDWRRLGVAVSRIVLRSAHQHDELPADHPALRQGWHAVERDGTALWRWTDGDASLPITADAEPLTVEVQVRQTMRYRLAVAEPQRMVA